MKKSILILFLTLSLASCQKESISPACAKCSLISWKYTDKWELLKVDTLWQDGRVCGLELSKLKSVPAVDTLSWLNCPPPVSEWPEFRIEIRKYIISKENN